MRDPHECPAGDDARDKIVATGQPHCSDGVHLPQVGLATGGLPAVGNACNVKNYILYRV